jgi:alpha-tubulin suppressor-like RCC1 family protein
MLLDAAGHGGTTASEGALSMGFQRNTRIDDRARASSPEQPLPQRRRMRRDGRLLAPRVALAIVTLAVCARTTAGSAIGAAASGPSVDEWGRPVASGGPGNLPTLTQSSGGLATIDAGNYADVLVLSNGTVWGWGVTSMTLTQVPGVTNVVQRPVDGNGSFTAIEQPGTDSSCPLSSTIVHWGRNHAPTVVTQLNCMYVVQLAEAATHTFALTSNGSVYVWGGQGAALGMDPAVKSEKIPTLNTALTALTSGTSAGVVLTTGMTSGGMLVNGQAWSWGDNQYGQCGCGSTAAVITSPTPVDQGSTVYTSIDQGGNLTTDGHELAIDTSGDVWAWGDNARGQLGIGTEVNSNVPVAVIGLPADIVDVRAGGMHSLALDSAGNVWAWGANQYGQVGNGTTTDALLPDEVLSGVSQISAGSFHSIAA